MKSTERKIIHIDLDAFFCAVEEKNNPALVGLPFAVGGNPNERGVVSSCSYAAREFGVRSAMSMYRATILCPELIIIQPNFKEYTKFSSLVMEVLRELSPSVEQISIDEAFLDVTDLPDSGLLISQKLQKMIVHVIGLPCSLGVATNKLVAKIATDKGKQTHSGIKPPNAITVVPPGAEQDFLAPLPIQKLWGIGPKTARRLENLGIMTIGNLAATPQHIITPIFGRFTHEMGERARGVDHRPVLLSHDVKSISQETTFARDISSLAIIKRTLWRLSETVGSKLRKRRLYAQTIKIKLRWANFTTITRQITLKNSIDQDRDIFDNALNLFENTWVEKQRIRLIGVGVSKFNMPARQLSLWNDSHIKNQQLQNTLDLIRKKYGNDIIQLGGGILTHDE